jgi:uncharacterized membrane protein YdfJ with MMPL/SSD domain
MRNLARWCFRHRRLVLAGWLAALIGATAIHTAAGSNFNDSFSLPGTQSFEALNLLQRHAPKQSGDRGGAARARGGGDSRARAAGRRRLVAPRSLRRLIAA